MLNKLIVISLLAFSFSSLVAKEKDVKTLSQQVAVTSKLDVAELQKFGLNQQIKGLQGYDIRARRIIVPAGGTIAEHGHASRPGIVYVVSGEITEYRGNKTAHLKTGDSVVEDAMTVHAYKNTSKQPCVLIAFDIPQQ
ncbi:MAG: cupin domain-containing protein [Burkholderiales bacterium]|nr:cupin domain-containing protein [Burkholderiales bacterium]